MTRERVLAAAHAAFVEHGYAGTTVAAVAASAGVSPETIYAALGGKRGLVEGVIELAITGPADVPLEQQEWFVKAGELPTPAERLRAYVHVSCAVLWRTSPVHAVIRGAADSEPFAVDLQRRLLRERLRSNTELLGAYVGDALRPGLSVKEAADRYCALSSPEMHDLLVRQLRWSRQRHELWLADLVEYELLGHGAS